MKIEGRWYVRGRGPVLEGAVDVEVPCDGIALRRADGLVCRVRGVERFVKYLSYPTLHVGEKVGFLVEDGCTLAVGDEVAIVSDLSGGEDKR